MTLVACLCLGIRAVWFIVEIPIRLEKRSGITKINKAFSGVNSIAG